MHWTEFTHGLNVGRARRSLVRAFASIGFLIVFATLTPIDNWWINQLAGPWNHPKGDVLVVLRSEATADFMGRGACYWCSVDAVRAWRDGGFREVVVVSGGLSGVEESVAERMGEFMVSQGIPAPAIRVETGSLSMRENALKSKAILEKLPGRKVLMTSDYHMFRAFRVFRKAGIDVEPRPIRDAANQAGSLMNRWPVFLDLCLETAKIAYYTARGWI